MQDFIESRNDEIFNIKQDELSSYTASLSIADIIRYIDKSNKNPILQSPDFQRDSRIKNNKSVWKRSTKLIFIDSLLRGLPSPSILIWEKINGNKKEFFLLDGSQRLSAIDEFVNGVMLNGKLQPLKLRIKQLKGSDYYNKSYNQLDEVAKTNFNNYRIDSIFIRYIGKDENREISVISEIFTRLNSGSFNLNRAEIRHAIFFKKKDFVFKIIDEYLNKHDSYFFIFLKDMKKYSQNKRGAMEVFLLRLLSYGYYISKHSSYIFNSTMDAIIDNYICALNDENELNSYLKNVNELFKYVHENSINSFYACKNKEEDNDSEILINKTAVLETFVEAIFSYILSEINNDRKIEQILNGIDWEYVEKIKNNIWKEGYFKNINKQSSFSKEASFFYTTTSNKSIWNRYNYLKQEIENGKKNIHNKK